MANYRSLHRLYLNIKFHLRQRPHRYSVKNLDKTVRKYADEFGVGPWKIWKINQEIFKDIGVSNIEKVYSARIARSLIGNTIWEIIEPLDDKNLFATYLRKHGEGVHHLGYEISDFEKALEFFKGKGIKTKQYGDWNGLKFAFLDLTFLVIYLFFNPYKISKKFLLSKKKKNIHIYGETPISTIAKIAKECEISSKDHIIELGSGRGRCCFWFSTFLIIAGLVLALLRPEEIIRRKQRT